MKKILMLTMCFLAVAANTRADSASSDESKITENLRTQFLNGSIPNSPSCNPKNEPMEGCCVNEIVEGACADLSNSKPAFVLPKHLSIEVVSFEPGLDTITVPGEGKPEGLDYLSCGVALSLKRGNKEIARIPLYREMDYMDKLELQNPHPDYHLDNPETCGVVGVPSAPDKDAGCWMAIGGCYPAGLLTGFNAAPI
jgi:hypothetical protein